MPYTSERCSSFKIEDLESYNRILSIPVVSSGLNIAENVYYQIKKTNDMLTWTLDHAEETVKAAAHNPAIGLLETPINTLDRVICRSLDVIETRLPLINLPPKAIYSNTKEYMSDVSTKFLKPVLKRADSVKKIGNTVLTSKYTEYAADKLDDALDVADAYIDKYLPDQEDQKDFSGAIPDTSGKKALHTIKHADRVSRKLQRRLTKRTLEHAKIIKEQSTEAIHVLFYVAELIVTDPKLALQKGKELWVELSKDEPENQARPKNVEELFVLVVRESARQFVHLVNYSSGKIIKLPKMISSTTQQASVILLENTQILTKKLHLEDVLKVLLEAREGQNETLNFIHQEINSFISKVLEKARQPDPPQLTKSTVALAVPKIEVNSKAANNKSEETSNKSNDTNNHNHGHHGHHPRHGQHGHHGHHGHKRNGAHSPSHKTETSHPN